MAAMTREGSIKDTPKDALKDAPDDSSIVEENQVIEDVDKGDACKECKKKMTVASLFKYVIFTRLKPIATILLQNVSVKVKAAGIIWHFYEDLCFNKYEIFSVPIYGEQNVVTHHVVPKPSKSTPHSYMDQEHHFTILVIL